MTAPAGVLSLTGRVAFVTGAARGIGAATARAFAAAGARLALVDVDASGLSRLAADLQSAGTDVLAFSNDVTDPATMRRAAGAAFATWGRLDVLVNNAGIVRDATLADVTDEDWAATLNVNLRGAMVCARAVFPYMKEAGSGRILSATSVVARIGNYGQTAYAASKGGVIAMTRAWARELGPQGITANAVAPGFIDTQMARAVPPKVLAHFLERIPAGRLGTPEEVAAVYLFLASDLASFINGAVVGVDGGLRL